MSLGKATSISVEMKPSHAFVTSNDHTSLLNVLGWFSIIVIVVVVLTRLGTRRAKSRTIGLDDYAIVVSAVRSSRNFQYTSLITSKIFAIAQTATMSVGVANGLAESLAAKPHLISLLSKR